MHKEHPIQNPKDNIKYFVEWGGKTWCRFVERAIRDFLSDEIEGSDLLEVGARYGKMSCFFALLGASVTAMDKNPDARPAAEKEAEKWGVKKKINFAYSHDALDKLPANCFDIVFTKSVLYSLKMPDFIPFVEKLKSKMKTGGRIVMIENMDGNFLHAFARHILFVTGIKSWKSVSFFTEDHIKEIHESFIVERIERTSYPPVCCIWARKSD